MSSNIHLLYHITHAFASVFANFFAGIAQLVEQRIRNAQVVGSSPIPSSIVQSPPIGLQSCLTGIFVSFSLIANKCISQLFYVFSKIWVSGLLAKSF